MENRTCGISATGEHRYLMQKETITSTQLNFFTLTFWCPLETFMRRSSFSSSSRSCHDRDATWQEIGHMCGSACRCHPPSSKIVVLLSFPNMYCLFDPSSTFVRFSVQNCSGQPIDHMVILRCMVSQC